uniref:Uncharacterized protein n=1 Tax=viral metagenome TaxID=1070528 RepID=A0A6C0B0G7_9ZZZZ
MENFIFNSIKKLPKKKKNKFSWKLFSKSISINKVTPKGEPEGF